MMLNLPFAVKGEIEVMSSVDLALLCVGTSKDAHSNFMKKAAKVLGDGVVNFYDTYTSSQGKTLDCLMLPEREACLLAMSYSYKLQARVYDAWQELKKSKMAAIPDFRDPVAAARAWADSEEQKRIAQQQLAIAAPKAEFVDRYVDSSGTYTFRQVAKMLGVKENAFREFLLGGDNPVMYRLAGRLTPYANHVEAGRFIQRTGVADNEHSYTESRFTAKGVEWIAGELAKSETKKRMGVA